jgi:GAF domain-containing protein
MAEELIISDGCKEEKYALLHSQVVALTEGESDVISNMANIASMIHSTFNFWWTGFYRVIDNQLILGPFQGPLACSRIGFGKGVCGTAWKLQKTVIVPDVEKFPGHIACSSASRSEIVVPVFDKVSKKVTAVLDIDSDSLDTFDQTDRIWLEKIIRLI